MNNEHTIRRHFMGAFRDAHEFAVRQAAAEFIYDERKHPQVFPPDSIRVGAVICRASSQVKGVRKLRLEVSAWNSQALSMIRL